MKLDPDDFVDHLDNTGKTPNFWRSWVILRDDLSEKLAEDQLEAVK